MLTCYNLTWRVLLCMGGKYADLTTHVSPNPGLFVMATMQVCFALGQSS